MFPKALQLVGRFYRYLETERQYSRHTLAAYKLEIGGLIRFCDAEGLSKWQELKPADLQAFIVQSHRAGLAPASLQRRLSASRSFLTFAGGEGAIKANVAESVQAPKSKRGLPRVLDIKQMQRLLEFNGDDPLSARDRAIMELLYSSAIRLTELTSLDCADLDLRDRTATVHGKGNKTRIVPVGAHALKALKEWLRARGKMAESGEPALFVNRRGIRIHQRGVQKLIAERAMQQGLPHVHPHMFRHSCATHLLESSSVDRNGMLNGWGLRQVSELLGHANINTTQIYTHVDAAHLTRVYQAAHPRARTNPAIPAAKGDAT
jgi:integrase/recombinase XerC